MRGIAFALVALAIAATPHPLAAQCYGPECERHRSGPPPYYTERPDFHSGPPQGQPYRSGPYEPPHPYGPPPHEQRPPYQPMPQSQPAYQQPAHQAQPRPPIGYSNVPPGMAPRRHDYRPARPDVTTSRTIVRSAPPRAGSGLVTISVAEYRDLQNQARELQRLLSRRTAAPKRPSPFPDVPPPARGNQPGPGRTF